MAPRRTRRRATTEDAVELPVTRRRGNRRAVRSPSVVSTNNEAPSELDQGLQAAQESKSVDYLSQLSTELVSLILDFVSPRHEPDLSSLAKLALVSKALSPIVKNHLYRNLVVTTRTNAFAIHRALHGNELSRSVKTIRADLGLMSKTSSQWIGWFLYHSSHSLCGIIGSCRQVLELTLYLPIEASAWCHTLCTALQDLRQLTTLTKDLDASTTDKPGAGHPEGMDIGWRPRKNVAMWSMSHLLRPLAMLRNLTTLRLCGLCSDSSVNPPQGLHGCRLTEVTLIEINVTNTDLLYLLGTGQTVKKLTIWRSSLLSKRGLTHVLKRCPNLEELRVGGSWFGAKDDEDTNYPLDMCLPNLQRLKILHVSGCLISPAALLIPTLNLDHLLISSCPSFAPAAVHAALAKMRSDPVPVRRLTLVDWSKDQLPMNVNHPADQQQHRGAGGQHHHNFPLPQHSGAGGPSGNDAHWSSKWRFCVRQTGEAKGCTVDGPLDDEER